MVTLVGKNWLIPYPLGFYDNKVFKEKLYILTYVQVCRIIYLRTDEKKLDESAFEDQTLALKITSEDSTSDRVPDTKKVNSKESQSLVTQTLKLQKPRSGL